MLNVINNDNIKIWNRYNIKEIEPGHLVQLELKKGRFGSSAGAELEVLRVDPKLTGRIIGKLVFYGFIPRKTGEYKEVLFDVKQICRNYTLDPIIIGPESYKGGKYNLDQVEFEAKRKPKR